MPVPDAIIDEIQQRIDLVELIGRVTPLKRAGRSWKGCCPFHQEKTPSFMVNPDKQLYYCFGCQAGGNALTFVMQTEQLTFPEAVESLAAQTGVEIDTVRGDDGRRDAKDAVIAVNTVAATFFAKQLASSQGAAARTYLTARGVTQETIARFGLGYAPEAWDGLVMAAREQQITERQLEQAGLAIARRGGHGVYDRFRHRIIFPIHDVQGRVIGFGGRVLGTADGPKYMNSPETPAFVKGRTLYGLAQAKQSMATEGAVLVEGYMDCIVLHQAGITQAVAPLGTALTEGHARLLKRYHHDVTLLFDADEAGAHATVRSLDILLHEGLAVRIARHHGTQDPDEFVLEHGAEKMRARLARAESLFEYKLASLRRERTQDSIEDRVMICRNMLSTLRQIPDPILQQAYAARLAEALQLDARAVTEGLADPQRMTQHTRPAVPAAQMQVAHTQAEVLLVGLLLNEPARRQVVAAQVDSQTWKHVVARTIYERLLAQPTLTVQQLATQEDGVWASFIAHAMHQADTVDSRTQAFTDCIQQLRRREHKVQQRQLQQALQAAERIGDSTQVATLLRQLASLNQAGEEDERQAQAQAEQDDERVGQASAVGSVKS